MKRNLIFCIAILCIAALCAAVLTACNPDSPGSNSDNGNNDDGGVFSRNMTMDSFVDTLCSMTNWTATETFTVAKNGESPKILSSSTMKIDVSSHTYEYAEEYNYENDDTGTYEIRAEKAYGFSENGIDYQVEQRNYDTYNNTLNENGVFNTVSAKKCQTAYNRFVFDSASVSSINEYYSGRYPHLAKYTDKTYKEYAFIELRVGRDIIEYLLCSVCEKDGQLSVNSTDTGKEHESYIEFRDGGIVYGHKNISSNETTCNEISIKNVGKTEVSIPADIKTEKENCQWASLNNYKGVSYIYLGDYFGYEARVWNSIPGGVTVEPTINGIKVGEIDIQIYNAAQKTEIRLYCDKDKNYCGEYADLGEIYSIFVVNESLVNIKYYGEWQQQ